MELTRFECGHFLCEKGIESSLNHTLEDFFMKLNVNDSILFEETEYCIGCPYENCFAKYLYSTDKFEYVFKPFFNHYRITQIYQKLILNKFDGFKIKRMVR